MKVESFMSNSMSAHEISNFMSSPDCDSRVIVDLEWSRRKWVVVTQLALRATSAVGDESLEPYMINGELYKMVAAISLNTQKTT